MHYSEVYTTFLILGCTTVAIIVCSTLSCRLSINVSGKVVYNHEVSPSWSINAYVQSLQQTHGLTTRDLYWRMWSLVNVLKCEQCHASFQCCELTRCPYHPQRALCSTKNGPAYSCCSQPAAQFSLIPEIQVCLRAEVG